MHASSGQSTQTPAQLMDARQCVLLGRYERAFTLCLSEAQLVVVLDLHNTRIERYRFSIRCSRYTSSHYGQLVNSLPRGRLPKDTAVLLSE